MTKPHAAKTRSRRQSNPSGSDVIVRLLRDAGLKVTPFRVRVLAQLSTDRDPLALSDLRAVVGGDPVTLQRTVQAFVAHGLAHRVCTNGRLWLYAGGAEPRHEVHPHFVCSICGKVRCLRDKLDQKALLCDMQVPTEFVVTKCDVILHGRCAPCLSTLNEAVKA